jgi:hypothetical protein
MTRILNTAGAVLVLLHAANASMNPLMLSRTAMLTSVRRVDFKSEESSSSLMGPASPSMDTNVDEWYDDGCDALLEASNTYERSLDVDTNEQREVAMCVSN